MKLPAFLQPRVLRQAIVALFSRPVTTRFPAEPFEPISRFRDDLASIPTNASAAEPAPRSVPPKCIDVTDDPATSTRHLVQHLDQCIWCGQCERYCPTKGGIRMTNEWDCVGFKPEDFEERCDKEILLCEVCGEVLAPVDALRWLAERLGPMAFGNPTLMLASLRDLNLLDEGVKAPEGTPTAHRRGDRVALHCPRCRRQTALTV